MVNIAKFERGPQAHPTFKWHDGGVDVGVGVGGGCSPIFLATTSPRLLRFIIVSYIVYWRAPFFSPFLASLCLICAIKLFAY